VGGKALRTDKPLDELVAISNSEAAAAKQTAADDDYDCAACSCMPAL